MRARERGNRCPRMKVQGGRDCPSPRIRTHLPVGLDFDPGPYQTLFNPDTQEVLAAPEI